MNPKKFNKNIIPLNLRGCGEQRRSFHYNPNKTHKTHKTHKIKINKQQSISKSLSLALITELLVLEVSSALSISRTS